MARGFQVRTTFGSYVYRGEKKKKNRFSDLGLEREKSKKRETMEKKRDNLRVSLKTAPY